MVCTIKSLNQINLYTQQPSLVPLGGTLYRATGLFKIRISNQCYRQKKLETEVSLFSDAMEADDNRFIANSFPTFLNFPSSTNFLRGA